MKIYRILHTVLRNAIILSILTAKYVLVDNIPVLHLNAMVMSLMFSIQVDLYHYELHKIS